MVSSPGFDQDIFRAVNALVEPAVRSGLLSSALCPLGVVSLETTGRRSGKAHRVPVLAMSTGEYVLVATARGERSDWFRNMEANPEVRYWVDGQIRHARAVVLGDRERSPKDLPEAVACMARSITVTARLLGWRFAVFVTA